MTNAIRPLADSIALITGASRGLGAALAVALADQGAHVVLLARTVGGLEAVDDTIRQKGGNATLLPFDLAKTGELAGLGPLLFERFGRLDIFIANAAMLGHLGPVAQFDTKIWDRVMAVNLTANQRLIQTLDPLLRKAEDGRVLFVADSGIDRLPAYGGAYAVSKIAFGKLAQSYAAETAGTRLRVNLVDPGPMRTSLRAEQFPGEDKTTLPEPATLTAPFINLTRKDNSRHGDYVRAAA